MSRVPPATGMPAPLVFLGAALCLVLVGYGAVEYYALLGGALSNVTRGARLATLLMMFVPISMGLIFFDAVRATSLFAKIQTLPEHMRAKLAVTAACCILVMAATSAGAVYMAEVVLPNRALAPPVWAGSLVFDLVLAFVLTLLLALPGLPLYWLRRAWR
ncbi:MAG: hypothetical protein QNJ67_07315 [Kiloniellales bacterium]|nr:hypothetical protein [Kiloniellales bacterium]